MHRNGIRAIMAPPRRVRTTDSRHGLPIAPNLIARDFTAAAPNRVWLADITYIPTAEGWLYLAAVMDLFSRKIVGWAMRDHMQVELAPAALTMAVKQLRPQARLLRQRPDGELLPHPQDRTRSSSRLQDPRRGPARYLAFIEGFYNRTRLHSAIGYIAPTRWSKNRLNPSTFSGEDQTR